MKARPLAPLLFALAIGSLPAHAADEAALGSARHFAEGRFVDAYYGISYQADGLERRERQRALFAGSLPGGAAVEIRVAESAEPLTAVQWRAVTRSRWANDAVERKDLVEGKDAFASLRLIRTDSAQAVVRHAYAWYPRGLQVFIVHVAAPQAGDASPDQIEKALAGLRVEDGHEAFRLAAYLGRGSDRDPRSPDILIQAAARYARPGSAQNLELAQRASVAADREARRQAEAGTLSAETSWALVFYGASVHLGTGQYAAALTSLAPCLASAAKLANPRKSEAACRFKLASAYSGLGRLDEAFGELRGALDSGDTTFDDFVVRQAKSEPSLANLRSDPRWKKLID